MKMSFLSVASRVNEELQDEVVYEFLFCFSNYFASQCLYCDWASYLMSVAEFVPVTLYSVPFCAAVLQCTKLFSYGCLWKPVDLLRFENVQSTNGELLGDKTFLFAFWNPFTVNSCTQCVFALLSKQDTQISVDTQMIAHPRGHMIRSAYVDLTEQGCFEDQTFKMKIQTSGRPGMVACHLSTWKGEAWGPAQANPPT